MEITDFKAQIHTFATSIATSPHISLLRDCWVWGTSFQ